jgi:hypothetical protein
MKRMNIRIQNLLIMNHQYYLKASLKQDLSPILGRIGIKGGTTLNRKPLYTNLHNSYLIIDKKIVD